MQQQAKSEQGRHFNVAYLLVEVKGAADTADDGVGRLVLDNERFLHW